MTTTATGATTAAAQSTAAQTAAAQTTAASAAKPGALSTLSGNFNDFLKLLMTQLQNQDPTAPLDTNQFTSQLVQFSSVEQQINTNSSLGKLIELTQGNEVLQSSALVGKQVEVQADSLSLQGGTAGLRFNTATPQAVSIGIYADNGAKLRDASVTSQAGSNAWTWDGRDNNGRLLPDGAYRTVVTAAGAGTDGQAVPFSVSGFATGVQRAADALKVQLGALQVNLSAVQAVTAQ